MSDGDSGDSGDTGDTAAEAAEVSEQQEAYSEDLKEGLRTGDAIQHHYQGEGDPERLFESFDKHEVPTIIGGGMAMALHGIEHDTTDTDVWVNVENREDARHVLQAVQDVEGRLLPPEGVPPEVAQLMAVPLDESAFNQGSTWSLTSRTAGPFDLHRERMVLREEGQSARGIPFKEVWERSLPLEGYEHIRVLNLDDLEAAKRAANREKDQLAIKQIEAFRQQQG